MELHKIHHGHIPKLVCKEIPFLPEKSGKYPNWEKFSEDEKVAICKSLTNENNCVHKRYMEVFRNIHQSFKSRGVSHVELIIF